MIHRLRDFGIVEVVAAAFSLRLQHEIVRIVEDTLEVRLIIQSEKFGEH
jgi:hypothetical protein